MKEAIRCCISCIFPCGTLDVVRVVHASGRVEEISGSVTAGDFMQAYPNHLLRKPPPSASLDAAVESPKPAILPPHAELQRGKIYFLMPVSSAAEKAAMLETARRKKSWKKKEQLGGEVDKDNNNSLKRRILPEKSSAAAAAATAAAAAQRNRRRGRVGVWRPHLESISEVSNNDLSPMY